MSRLFYPAIFHKAEEGGFWITFPDIPECMTQGDDILQAYEMTVDALDFALTSREKENLEIPIPSLASDVFVEKDEMCILCCYEI